MQIVLNFWVNSISKVISFLFTIKIINGVSLGSLLLGCSFLGLVIWFIFGTDFVPNIAHISNRSSTLKNNYQPRHEKGFAGKNYDTRISRHRY